MVLRYQFNCYKSLECASEIARLDGAIAEKIQQLELDRVCTIRPINKHLGRSGHARWLRRRISESFGNLTGACGTICHQARVARFHATKHAG